MKDKKVLDAIATLYNENSSEKAYYNSLGESANADGSHCVCRTLLEALFDIGYRYDIDFTREKINDGYGEYWKMKVLI